MKEKDLIMKYVGGSHLYGLSCEGSDVDWRGVYMHTDLQKVLRFATTEKSDSVSETGEDGDDVVYYELRRYLELLRKTNPQTIESLFVDRDWFDEFDPRLNILLEKPYNFMDSERLVTAVKGYSHNEYRLAMGERTGRLGGKRKGNLDEYGFSPKNVSQMIRLSEGSAFLQEHGIFPLNLKEHLPKAWELAFEVKTQPENFTTEQVDKICLECLDKANKVEDRLKWTFKDDLAVDILKRFYTEHFS